MGGTSVHHLRLPRLVTGMVGRARTVERVAVLEDVPVAIPICPDREAPLLLEYHLRRCRVRDGRAYLRLGEGRETPEKAWAKALARESAWLAERVGAPPVEARPGIGRFYGWDEGFEAASPRRGLGEAGRVRFREIVDDGREALDAAVARLGERMLMIGPELWLRAGAPRHEVQLRESVRWLADIPLLGWREDTAMGRPWDAGHFRIDRPDEALAYARALSRPERRFHDQAYMARARIHDPGLLDDLYARIGEDDVLAMQGVAHGVVEALRPCLGILPLPAVRLWVELGERGQAADLDGLRRWMNEVGAAREALAASRIPRSKPHGEPDALDLLDAAILRYETFERPRMHLGRDGDAAALLAL